MIELTPSSVDTTFFDASDAVKADATELNNIADLADIAAHTGDISKLDELMQRVDAISKRNYTHLSLLALAKRVRFSVDFRRRKVVRLMKVGGF